MNKLLILAVLAFPVSVQAAPFPKLDATYPWIGAPHLHIKEQTVRSEVPVPDGYTRVEADGWGEWLRGLPVLPEGSEVHLVNGQVKPNQHSHYRVIALDVLPFQECADSILRLRAEYLVSHGRTFQFSGLSFSRGTRAAFDRFLNRVFVTKSTANMAGEMQAPKEAGIRPGDVLVHVGHPGHAVLVLDVVEKGSRRPVRQILLANGFMPAQQFHILLNPKGGVWFDEQDLATSLKIPLAGIKFTRADLRRF